MNTTKKSLFTGIVSLVLCFSMLIGTTFAWFTDMVTSSGNIIQSGTLDIGMYWSEDNVVWNTTEGEGSGPIFSYDNWEPGYTEVRYIKVTNEGSLAFKYSMLLSPNGVVGNLAEVIDVSYDIVTANDSFVAPAADNKQGSLEKIGTLSELISINGRVAGGVLLPANETADDYYTGEIVVCVAFHMQESAGNEYQNGSIGSTFDIKLYATQFDYESDSFDSSYDDGLEFPEMSDNETITVDVTNKLDENNQLTEKVTIGNSEEGMSAVVAEGASLKPGTTELTLTVKTTERSGNIDVNRGQASRSLDVHVEGLAEESMFEPEHLLLSSIKKAG